MSRVPSGSSSLVLHPLLNARVALYILAPDVPKFLDAEALMVGIVAGEVAMALESEDGVSAQEEQLFEIAHPFVSSSSCLLVLCVCGASVTSLEAGFEILLVESGGLSVERYYSR
jgi:hypothetical protein